MTDSQSSVVQQQLSLTFATLIGHFRFPESGAINEALKEAILDREARSATQDYANVGGWHSAADLLEWPIPQIAILRSWISEALTRMVQGTGQLPEVAGRQGSPRGGFKVSAWANISRRGNYHRLHNHPGNAWSGCYYVAAQSRPDSLGGVLEFYDPRPFTEMVETPGSPYGQRVLVRPTPGLMVLFPSWLYHFVHPSDSDTERISIAFNAAWRAA
jgi:uncharacterized protein (TIGR02466 family)